MQRPAKPARPINSMEAGKGMLYFFLGLAYVYLYVDYGQKQVEDWVSAWPLFARQLVWLVFFMPVIVLVALATEAGKRVRP